MEQPVQKKTTAYNYYFIPLVIFDKGYFLLYHNLYIFLRGDNL